MADETRYRPFDQDEKLPPRPWAPDDPALIVWEAAHGHDARLKCYPELGCVLVEADLERERDEARTALAELEAEVRRLLPVARTLSGIFAESHIIGLPLESLPRIATLLREPAARPDGAHVPDEERR